MKKESYLTIHVINSGIGESIIIQFPNSRWGVVDCYTHSLLNPTENPTLQFLIHNNVKELEFLCLTHPHDDHYRGMSQLLEHYEGSIKEFWRFGGINEIELLSYLEVNATENKDEELTSSTKDLHKTFKKVNAIKKKGKLSIQSINDFKRLYSDNVEQDILEIFSLGPSSNLVHDYQSTLKSCFSNEGTIDISRKGRNHNMVSVVLLIKYGDTKVLLGADAEKKSWNYILQDKLRTEDISSHAIKMSHHGSTNSIINGLWEKLSKDNKPYVIITPYVRKSLPQEEAINHVSQYTSNIASTCLTAIPFTFERIFNGKVNYGFKEQMALRMTFLNFSRFPKYELGTCSFSFDSKGNCINEHFSGDAGCFTLPEKRG